MREQPKRAYFTAIHEDGNPCVVHAKVDWGKAKGLKQITEEEAKAISVARRAKER